MNNLSDVCKKIELAAGEAAAFIRKEGEVFDIKRTEKKGLNDFVSYVDKGAEKMLVESLGNIMPEAGFITEEGTSKKKGEKYCWVIDPLDGTTNFLHGVHPYSISIGLMEYDEVIAGVVYEVGGMEIFKAWKDGGSWLNDQPIHVSEASRLSDSLIVTGFPYSEFNEIDQYMKLLAYVMKNSHGVRRLGSAAIDLAYVACGRFEVFYEYGLHPWDIAAGILLVREAGGKVSDFSGNEKDLDGKEIVAANSGIYNEVREIVANFMKK